MVAFLLRIEHPFENTQPHSFTNTRTFFFTHMQANGTHKYYSNIVKITHFFRLYSGTCAYINNRKCSYTIQYKGILYIKSECLVQMCFNSEYINELSWMCTMQTKKEIGYNIQRWQWHSLASIFSQCGILLVQNVTYISINQSKSTFVFAIKNKSGGKKRGNLYLIVPVCRTYNANP